MKEFYDERFCRMWEFYLAGSEAAFRHQDHMVAQIQLARSQDAAPLTRDYMVDWERAHAGLSPQGSANPAPTGFPQSFLVCGVVRQPDRERTPHFSPPVE